MSEYQIELVVHPLCPYAQRALYTSTFKNVPLTITHVSLANPPDWFLELNPLGEVPSCRVTVGGKSFKLTESLNISEFFESLPGPALYPRLPNGERDPVAKCLIDVFIKLRVQRFAGAYYTVAYGTDHTAEDRKEAEDAFLELNQYLEGGYAMRKILDVNELTFADVMLLPHVERVVAYKDVLPEWVRGLDLTNIWKWYENMTAQPWTVPHRAGEDRLKNLYKQHIDGVYQGLDLPVTRYDNQN